MPMKDPKHMTFDELESAINGAERVLGVLRKELEARNVTQLYCGHKWGQYVCKLKPGHKGNHAQGFLVWAR